MSAAVDRRLAELNWRLEHDQEFYCAHVIKIRVKKAELGPFVWNPVQRYVYDCLLEQWRIQGYIRAMILKGRQMGVSTLINAIGYGETSRQENRSSLVIAHDDSASDNLFRMIQEFYAHDNVYHPEAIRNNANQLLWDTPAGMGLGSRYLVETVGKSPRGSGKGRSFTFQFVHFSEVAFYGQAGPTTIGSVNDAVPSEIDAIKGTTVIQETTANGYDPLFHPAWEELQQDREHGYPTDQIGIFLPWFWHRPYSQDVGEKERKYILQSLSEDERWLLRQKDVEGKSVTTGQLAWRRWKIKNGKPPPGMSKDQYFRQEYPATSEEAFQATGSHIFDIPQVIRLISDAPEPKVRYEFQEESGEPMYREDGRFLVYEEPDPMRSYIVGSDVAEGLNHGDWTTADVIDHHSGVTVATWHGHIHPDHWGQVLAKIGHRYNNAWIGVERNMHGIATVTRLLDMKYKRLYVEQVIDAPGAKPRRRYGWLTTKKTKPYMVDTLTDMMDPERGFPDDIRDKETYREMLHFQKDAETGEYGAPPPYNDDRLMAKAISLELRKRLPTPKQQAAKARSNTNRHVAPPPTPGRKQSAGRSWKGHV